jgi:hypothetical protein
MNAHVEQLVYVLGRDESVHEDLRRAALLEQALADPEVRRGAGHEVRLVRDAHVVLVLRVRVREHGLLRLDARAPARRAQAQVREQPDGDRLVRDQPLAVRERVARALAPRLTLARRGRALRVAVRAAAAASRAERVRR